MTENDFLQLVRRWQDPGKWVTVEALGFNAADFEMMADNLGADARLILNRGDVAQAQTLKAESDHLRNCAADVRRQRAEMAGQFMQIETWVREHRPELLEFVPIPKFDGEPSDAIRDLKRLESRIRKPAAETPAGHPGHSKNKTPPEDVREINRMMRLKRWQGKTPIEVCRAYIQTKHKNANEEFIETQAQSLKRKRNRY